MIKIETFILKEYATRVIDLFFIISNRKVLPLIQFKGMAKKIHQKKA